MAIWFLSNFTPALSVASDNSQSILAVIAKQVAPLFAPLGFSDWRLVTALIAGLTAKESVLSTLSVLCKGAPVSTLFGGSLSAVCFLVFCILYMPCAAAAASIARELGSKVLMAAAMTTQTAFAWLIAFLVYTVGTWIGEGDVVMLLGIAASAALFIAAVSIIKSEKAKVRNLGRAHGNYPIGKKDKKVSRLTKGLNTESKYS